MQQSSEHLPLTEKDLHCIARIMQGALYMTDMFWACGKNCRYAEECFREAQARKSIHFYELRDKLTKITGVYLGLWVNRFESEEEVRCTRLDNTEQDGFTKSHTE